MKKIKIGFLPLYIKLYDDCNIPIRDRLEAFYETIAKNFEKDGFDVVRSSICRITDEFKSAVDMFEKEGADCIVTWHAAYSPSLESSAVLASTKLPIVVLDTTDTYAYNSPKDESYCHGIHGVMDMCNLLKRNGKKYAIAAGHYPNSDVLQRAEQLVRASVAANSIKGTKSGSIGGSFEGMGDFLISDKDLLERFGVEAVYSSKEELEEIRNSISDADVKAEMKKDYEKYNAVMDIDPAIHERTVKDCLTIRKWVKEKDLSAFTVNFTQVCPKCGLNIMPFMEACKQMANGIGYAGEGDILTATITGALIRGFEKASFIEIFCPDWKDNLLLLSHMGEYNEALVMGKPEMKSIDFKYGPSVDPVVTYGHYMPGKAVFVNVFKDADGTYSLLAAPVEMVKRDEDLYQGSVRGWLKPPVPVADFLKQISEAGVTHHSSLVYDASIEAIEYFAKMLNMKTYIIK